MSLEFPIQKTDGWETPDLGLDKDGDQGRKYHNLTFFRRVWNKELEE